MTWDGLSNDELWDAYEASCIERDKHVAAIRQELGLQIFRLERTGEWNVKELRGRYFDDFAVVTNSTQAERSNRERKQSGLVRVQGFGCYHGSRQRAEGAFSPERFLRTWRCMHQLAEHHRC